MWRAPLVPRVLTVQRGGIDRSIGWCRRPARQRENPEFRPLNYYFS
uniref:Uncharacterized protein n=1 Tax=Anopheles albimanus TaxID=7167 RepID=A0A182FZ65_ANOAL